MKLLQFNTMALPPVTGKSVIRFLDTLEPAAEIFFFRPVNPDINADLHKE